MPIASTDIIYRLSGGAGNASNNASLGGIISSTVLSGNVYDDVSSIEAGTGDTEYRCLYVKNNHGTLTLQGAVLWLTSNTTGNRASIGLGSSAINGTEQTVANENTSTTGVTYTQPSTKATGLVIGDLVAGATKAFWFQRTIPASAAGGTDTFNFRVEGDTAP